MDINNDKNENEIIAKLQPLVRLYLLHQESMARASITMWHAQRDAAQFILEVYPRMLDRARASVGRMPWDWDPAEVHDLNTLYTRNNELRAIEQQRSKEYLRAREEFERMEWTLTVGYAAALGKDIPGGETGKAEAP
jgi:hypothetical protein